ncbi:FliM/FliN family flagellar motor switch protein [Arcobacter sp. CECT 8985]|uniref:FliM/FliN family flagellar motor switch protein n=1 Tax=Arcobacter sp. CECT 8985 TaxID=1935424 RepID=UPI00100B5010|nr:FliM/FliN family flagellar motor switch protein [Arcobacter sp. CECT 8985]RXJ87922.1 flagellar motor switch protein FliY [Arcobacter sp. CECT 8985]
MASDLSNILKEELSNTLEQLLSKSSSIDNISLLSGELPEQTQCIEVDVKFEFSAGTTNWSFFIPTISATKFEYFMLGGMGDLKEHIDDEIADAVNEIISNVCGSFTTSVNAQNFADIGSIKFELENSSIVESSSIASKENSYEFALSMDSEKLPVIISFDNIILPYISSITGVEENENEGVTLAPSKPVKNEQKNTDVPKDELSISSLLSENSAHNLQLLFNIKLKLSVRLGTKNFLLKDILRWDIGEIIELDQMVNEPLEILVNGIKIGEGEAVIVEGKFGLKVKSIGNESLRLNQLGLE